MRYLLLSPLLIFSSLVLAQELVEFENGQVANAEDINTNFQALKDSFQGIDVGAALLTGEGNPSELVGSEGDLYLDTATLELWGPLTNGQWSLIDSLKGSSCSVVDENNGIYIRCDDGSEAELSAAPTAQDSTIGTFSIGDQTVDLTLFSHHVEKTGAAPEYSRMIVEFNASSLVQWEPAANNNLAGTIVFSGADEITLNLLNFIVASRQNEISPNGTIVTRLSLAVSVIEWSSPTSSLLLNQPASRSDGDCQIPTNFRFQAAKSSEEAFDLAIWNYEVGPIPSLWGSPELTLSPEFFPVTFSHSNLLRVPCFFDALTGGSVSADLDITIYPSADETNTVQLEGVWNSYSGLTISPEAQSLITSWEYDRITETLGGVRYCYDILTNRAC